MLKTEGVTIAGIRTITEGFAVTFGLLEGVGLDALEQFRKYRGPIHVYLTREDRESGEQYAMVEEGIYGTVATAADRSAKLRLDFPNEADMGEFQDFRGYSLGALIMTDEEYEQWEQQGQDLIRNN